MAGMEAAMGDDAGSEGATAGGMPAGGAAGAEAAGGQQGDQPVGSGGVYGLPGGSGSGGPLTPAEQIAILDARLEKGTGEFDSMILEEQATQRQASRERPAASQESAAAGGGGSSGGAGAEGDMADAGSYGGGGGYSTGGGMGGVGGGSGEPPQDPAKYPPPKDIPSGNDDDVVARQLREAAMREPDPAVREKLWDEYRKYKGIAQ